MIWIAIAALAVHNLVLEKRLRDATAVVRGLVILILEEDETDNEETT